MTLKGKNFLITGAAGRIGSASARYMYDLGATLHFADISDHALKELSSNFMPTDCQSVYIYKTDLTTEKGINSLLEDIYSNINFLDGVLHSAYPTGEGWGDHFGKLELEHINHNLSLQLGSAIYFSQQVLDCFLKQGGGNLIHVSSIQGVQPPKFNHYEGTSMSSPIEYAAIKSGIISITRWLAKFYPKKNIRVNCVSPGGILDNQDQKFLTRYRESCSNIGMLNPMSVASVIAFLFSDSSYAINGQNIIIDDGWTL